MSRIYQGGQAEPTYQGTVSNQEFNPNQVAGNERAIKEEGQRDLQDLETQNRERLRDEDMEFEKIIHYDAMVEENFKKVEKTAEELPF